tara:strand:- start:128 stop:1063 length:936 start_codon:yes stop_codon:yes gene_type:complete
VADKPLALVITGPTASGKSSLAYALCERFPERFELISVDSAQVYRGLDIGAAKPTDAEQRLVPHHLIDIRDPTDPYTAHDFVTHANRLLESITARGKMPLMVGGTMLYLKSLRSGLAELPSASPVVRAALESEAAEKGWPYLHERLTKIDPVAAARIKPSDRQRLQRALEVFELTGRKLSDLQAESGSNPTFDAVEVAIEPPNRAELHQRIATRFDQMLEDGLVPEVEALREVFDLNPTLPAMKSVGYRQVWDYLEGDIDWAEMRLRGIIATRQLAKRQLTWLRGWSHLHRLHAPSLDALLKIKPLAHILD